MPGPRVAVGFIGDKKPTRCMHFDTMPNQTPLRHKATSALSGSAPVSLLASLLVGEVVHA